jgi:glycosyltransferase involved in cell wall biosynthesis
MRKVLHVINGEFFSGAERVQDLLAGALRPLGYDVVFVLLKPGQFNVYRSNRDSTTYITPMRSRLDMKVARRLDKIINAENIELIHTHTPRAAIIGRVASILAGCPHVHHIHSPTLHDTHHALRNLINAVAERLSLIGTSRVFTVSESLRIYMRKWGLAGSRIVVAPNGVPTRPVIPDRDFPRKPWTLGMIALFRPRKGVDLLIHALSILLKQGYAARLHLVGSFEEPEYKSEVQNLADHLGVTQAMELVGHTDDVNKEFDRMDLFVLPSRYGEGMPMVILEALASGVPVVASRLAGIGEVIREGIEGSLVEPNDPVGLAEGIAKFLSGEYNWENFRQAGLERQRTEYSDRTMALRVAQQYDFVLSNG